MANVMFKRGIQAQLPTTGASGVFYLTTDTNRLYVGKDNGEMALLNQTVQIVDNVNALPSTGIKNDFYYCSAENILAIRDNDSGNWIQINKNTNDIVQVVAINQGTRTVDEEKNELTYPFIIKQQKKDINGTVTDVADLEFAIKISKTDLEKVIFAPASVGLTVNNEEKGVEIAAIGSGSNADNTVLLEGGTNVALTGTKTTGGQSKIVISSENTTYGISTATDNDDTERVNVLLTDSKGDNSKAGFKAGNNLTIQRDNDGNIVYEHAEKIANTRNSEPATLSSAGSFSVISDITATDGHVSEIVKTTYTLPTDTKIEEVYKNGNWNRTLKDNNGTTFSIDFSEEVNGYDTSLKNYIGEELAKINSALTYKGTVDSFDTLPTENVEIGDVYLFATADGDYKVGDMVIAVSKTGNTEYGIIGSEDLSWTYVPSGDELNTDTLFEGVFSIKNNSASFGIKATVDEATGVESEISGDTFVLKGGTDIEITSENDEAVLSHKIYTVAKDEESNIDQASFAAITDLEYENGHIKKITKKGFTQKTYTINGIDNQIKLTDNSGADQGVINLKNTQTGNNWSSNWIAADITNNEFTIKHKILSAINQSVTNQSPLSANGTLNIISEVVCDEAGHLTKVGTQTLTLPENTKYELFIGDSLGNSYTSGTPYLTLKDTNGVVKNIGVKSETLNILVESNDVKIDLVWGTFDD